MDYIPIADSAFKDWVKNYAEYINVNFAALGLTVDQNTALQAFFTAWEAAYDAHVAEQATASSITQQKDTARKDLEEYARELTNLMQSSSATTTSKRLHFK